MLVTFNSLGSIFANSVLLNKFGVDHSSDNFTVEREDTLTYLLWVTDVEERSLFKIETSFAFPEHSCDFLSSNWNGTADSILSVLDVFTNVVKYFFISTDRSLKHI